jgi:dolichol kinase
MDPVTLLTRPPASSSQVATKHGPAQPLGLHPLTYREWKRRLWHMSPGALPFLLAGFPHRDPLSPTLWAIILVLSTAIAARILFGFTQIQRRGEGHGLASVAGYALPVLLLILLFPRHLEIGLSLLGVLAFGDGTATLFGLLLRGPRLPWNHAKTWSGLTAFLTCGGMMTAAICWLESHNPEAADPMLSPLAALTLTFPAVVVAAIAESLRSRWNDNVRVGISAGLMLCLMHWLTA